MYTDFYYFLTFIFWLLMGIFISLPTKIKLGVNIIILNYDRW